MRKILMLGLGGALAWALAPKTKKAIATVPDGSGGTATVEVSYTEYTVRRGDSLSLIARAKYGDAMRWPTIYEANRDQIKDPNLIYPGQVLRIPKL
jgi:nucleoid-associated protein YgaU